MDEDSIIKFRERASSYFEPLLVKEGYAGQHAQELAFYVAKVLEDALPLLENINSSESNSEVVLDNIHMLYTNKEAFNEGHRLLLFEK